MIFLEYKINWRFSVLAAFSLYRGIDTGPVGAYRPACQAGLPGCVWSISSAIYEQPDRPACQAGYWVYPHLFITSLAGRKIYGASLLMFFALSLIKWPFLILTCLLLVEVSVWNISSRKFFTFQCLIKIYREQAGAEICQSQNCWSAWTRT